MTSDSPIARWHAQSPMTDPGEQATLLRALPSDVSDLCRIVGNLLIHCEWMAQYGVSESDFPMMSRETLPVATRLAQMRERDGRSLAMARAPRQRLPGTCRDYAVLLCALLRAQGTAARVRCGFAAYFGPGRWEDHWVCERWIAEDRRWAVADAQLDAVMRRELKIAFDHTDVPKSAFLTAGEAWLRCRSGALEPAGFGHGDVTGLWFVHVNVVRDHLALNGEETSAWDTWRQAGPGDRFVPEAALARLNEIARPPEAELGDGLQPPWP